MSDDASRTPPDGFDLSAEIAGELRAGREGIVVREPVEVGSVVSAISAYDLVAGKARWLDDDAIETDDPGNSLDEF